MSESRTTDPGAAVPGAARGPIPTTGDPGVEAFGYHQELKRSLSFTDLLVYGLIFIGLTAIGEILRARSIHLFHVDIRMKSGRVVRFTSDQKAEAEALAGLLRTRTR